MLRPSKHAYAGPQWVKFKALWFFNENPSGTVCSFAILGPRERFLWVTDSGLVRGVPKHETAIDPVWVHQLGAQV